jgi:ribosomal protein S18 acetylase RimI-like enzyme
MSLFVIDEVHLNQVEQLQSISRETFYETYCSMNTKENMDKYLKENLSISTLENELKNPNSLFFIIRDLDKNIGYLKLNMGPAQTDIKDANALEIERIYVIKEYQGKKAGQQLYEKTIQVAKEKMLKYIWLGVWQENPKAIKFYTKNGFEIFDQHVFKLGDEEQTDYLMRLFI